VAPFVVAIPVGPSPEEVPRVRDLLAALRVHEPRAQHVVLVDDGGRRWPSDVAAIPNPRRGHGIGTLGGTCTATLAALRFAHERHPGAWVLRLDSDALVIGPFADAIEAAWRPTDGVLGSCHRTCNGDVRDVSAWAKEIRRHKRAVWAFARPPRRPWWVRPAQRHVRATLLEAARRGYAPGEHCIAAGCAISAPMVDAMARRGMLDHPRRWLYARLGDDIMLGAQARALGLGLRDLHGVFALKHIGLPDAPPNLLARDVAVIHSLKNDPDHSEPELRAFFEAARA
jgi:hypothetical protein